MCGIIGYIGHRPAQQIIIEGLKRLEYRGYDSSGIAILGNNRVRMHRAVGKLHNLEEKLHAAPLPGNVGIGHTRWATHGRPSENNAHPHCSGRIIVVHNGIVENYLQLKDELAAEGRRFYSETDTEVICHLIDRNLSIGLDLEEGLREALRRIKGSYAIGVMDKAEPGKLLAARMESPLVVGIGERENFIASDIPALLSFTRKVLFLEDGEIAVLTKDGVKVIDLDGSHVEKAEKHIEWSPVMAEKGGYRHFMLKEIFEQPRAIVDSLRGRILPDSGEIFLEGMKALKGNLEQAERIALIACGTSWHAALVGRFMIEALAGIPAQVELASEFRYRDPLVDDRTLLIPISQSGETADTLAGLREGQKRGSKSIGICNVMGSSMSRCCDMVLYTRAGPEIGVASTKAFTTQMCLLYLLAIYMAQLRGRLDHGRIRKMILDLIRVPGQVEAILDQDQLLQTIARKFFHSRDFLYLGRGINFPVALEGALKLKEISYIHAEGYPAGEMKHGPIALIDEQMPVVVLVTRNRSYEKILANIEEVRARKGIVIAIAGQSESTLKHKVDEIFFIPENNEFLMPILLTIPLQLLAYHIAVFKGTDVDQPRNLAKSVTVE